MTRLDPKREIWMSEAETRRVMAALGDARFVGGAVRNALLNRPVSEVDIATPLEPDEVMQRLKAADIAFVPTGLEHGTITAIVNSRPFEITTLRRDVSTDGRRAVVAFTKDWKEDAQRRDFTMNALYASADGEILDVVGGVADLGIGRVRFVGDPDTRIREDYLRILRLFRFHAWYGKGEIDSAALKAAVAAKANLAKLSGERVQRELLKLLAADNPAPVLRSMAATSVMAEILPGHPSLARLEKLVAIDADNFFTPDPVLRLAALLPSDAKTANDASDRLKLSNADRERLCDLAGANEKIVSYLSIREVRKMLYRLGKQRFRDRVMLRWAEDAKDNTVSWRAMLAMADAWERPQFPLTGRDVMAAGVPHGPLVGKVLSEVEEWWIDSDFTDDPFSLAERLKAVVQATAY